MVHNLDSNVAEYFEFTIRGFMYKFRHLTMDEIAKLKELSSIENADNQMQEYLFTFIEPVNADTPPFSETSKKMLVPHWNAFNVMIRSEFGL
jgi:hypothetical protein